ncbi:hypothetical protein CPB83DRAFT_113741 [Crepidotus variabilis]|uniref:C3H1-type domain-containing protein n=1 Tax=Crepidotus variabilis TaxID=179855 RepID=A0A9P6E4I4_9AGAR|nr:hypothetical protein CPB83DRAFT_113741 [Crepidotus variabilis]
MSHNTTTAFGKPWSVSDGKSRTQTECRFYQQTGNCAFGDKCHYKHSSRQNPVVTWTKHEALLQSPNNNAPITSIQTGIPAASSKQPCKYWLKSGSCGRGDKCWFSHPDKTPNIAPEEDSRADSAINTTDNGENEICWGWKAGRCHRTADACRWRHDNPEKSTQMILEDSLSDSMNTSPASWRARTVSKQENVPTITQDNTHDESWLKVTVCKYWEAGGCMKGDKCQFRHHKDEKVR